MGTNGPMWISPFVPPQTEVIESEIRKQKQRAAGGTADRGAVLYAVRHRAFAGFLHRPQPDAGQQFRSFYHGFTFLVDILPHFSEKKRTNRKFREISLVLPGQIL